MQNSSAQRFVIKVHVTRRMKNSMVRGEKRGCAGWVQEDKLYLLSFLLSVFPPRARACLQARIPVKISPRVDQTAARDRVERGKFAEAANSMLFWIFQAISRSLTPECSKAFESLVQRGFACVNEMDSPCCLHFSLLPPASAPYRLFFFSV